MMLSEILNRFFVLPLNQSELVCFSTEDHPKHGEIIVVTWKDSDTLDSFCQKFVDQEVDLSDATRFKGQFSVTPIGDVGPVAFVALNTVPLTRPKRRPYNASGSLSEYGVFPECDVQQPEAPSGTINVVGMPEFDGLLDHIYEYGTAAEGVIEKANAFARAVIARYAPQQPAATRVRCGDERYELDAYLWRRESTQEWVLELSGAINNTSFTNRFPVPLSYAPEDAVSLPNYAQQPATPVEAEAVLGSLPALINNPEAWPAGYADGFNDCARLAYESVKEALAEQFATTGITATQQQQNSVYPEDLQP